MNISMSLLWIVQVPWMCVIQHSVSRVLCRDSKVYVGEGTCITMMLINHAGTRPMWRVINTYVVENIEISNICKKSFSLLMCLKQHEHLHSGERPCTCDVCNKSFTEQGHLKAHQCIHSGECPYSYHICNKSFTEQGHLKVHHRIDSERPYTCDVCNKLLKVRCDLDIHQHIHSGERPYICDICHKSFVYQGNLKLLMQI
jgi:uncharacterized Zn-finger protein